MNRMKNCIGIFATALKIRLSRLCAIDFPVRYRCTWDWSHPKYERNRNVPPNSPLQILNRSYQSNFVVTAFNRPAAPARYTASLTETDGGSSTNTVTSAITSPRKMMHICCTSDHVTALIPPRTVYVMTIAPINEVVKRSGTSRITESTIAGA